MKRLFVDGSKEQEKMLRIEKERQYAWIIFPWAVDEHKQRDAFIQNMISTGSSSGTNQKMQLIRRPNQHTHSQIGTYVPSLVLLSLPYY